MAWVTRDFTTHIPGQLSLKQGQQVEVLEVSTEPSSGQLVRVRLEVSEGLVPVSCLQMAPRTGGSVCEGKKTVDYYY